MRLGYRAIYVDRFDNFFVIGKSVEQFCHTEGLEINLNMMYTIMQNISLIEDAL